MSGPAPLSPGSTGPTQNLRRPGDRLAALFGAAVAWTFATSLRVPGMPLGIGELLLVAWLAATTLGMLFAWRVHVSRTSTAVVAFWGVALPTMLAGLIVGLMLGVPGAGDFHNALAAVLTAAISCAFVLAGDMERRVELAVRAYVVALIAPVLLLLAISATGRLDIGPLSIWYQHARFAAFSENPNQLAFALLPVPFFALEVARRERGRRRAFYLSLALVSIPLGALTFSDALAFAWAVGLLALGVVWWLKAAGRQRGTYMARASAVIIVPVIVLSLAAGLGGRAVSLAEEGLQAGYSGSGDHGADRVARWQYALEAVSRSPVVGLGPGAFSGPTGPFQEEEAHNTLLDWLTNTGVVGTVTFLAFAGVITGWALASFQLNEVIIVAVTLVFASFHYVLRQPLFWFLMISVAVAGECALRRRAAVPGGVALRAPLDPGPNLTSW